MMIGKPNDIRSYRLQLQQVEADILTDPDNSELKKLRFELQDIIMLIKDLKTRYKAAANKIEPAHPLAKAEESQITLRDVEDFVARNRIPKVWKVGDKCRANCHQTGRFHDARITAIHPNGQVNVAFMNKNYNGTTTESELLEFIQPKRKRRDFRIRKRQEKQQQKLSSLY